MKLGVGVLGDESELVRLKEEQIAMSSSKIMCNDVYVIIPHNLGGLFANY